MREYTIKSKQESNGEITHSVTDQSGLDLEGSSWDRAACYEVESIHERLIRRNRNMVIVESKITARKYQE